MMSKKGGKKMNALAEFIQQNKQKIKRISDSNSPIKSNGVPTIGKNDPWLKESEWDDHYRELDKDK